METVIVLAILLAPFHSWLLDNGNQCEQSCGHGLSFPNKKIYWALDFFFSEFFWSDLIYFFTNDNFSLRKNKYFNEKKYNMNKQENPTQDLTSRRSFAEN